MPIDTDQPAYASSQYGYDIEERKHLGGSYPCGDSNTWMPDIWEHLFPIVTAHCNDRSVIDIGCGHGYFVEWCLKRGTLCLGVEGDSVAIINSKAREHVVVHDYADGPFIPSREFDLAWSAEFVEHVQACYIPHYMATFQACRYACITHGEPGQNGHHHVNCQTSEYWVDVFGKYGFEHQPDVTKWMRATDIFKAGWGRRTLMFFRRTGPSSVIEAPAKRIVTPDDDDWPPKQ